MAKVLRRINMRAKDALNDVNGMKKRYKNRKKRRGGLRIDE
jgi:hypothetical protein